MRSSASLRYLTTHCNCCWFLFVCVCVIQNGVVQSKSGGKIVIIIIKATTINADGRALMVLSFHVCFVQFYFCFYFCYLNIEYSDKCQYCCCSFQLISIYNECNIIADNDIICLFIHLCILYPLFSFSMLLLLLLLYIFTVLQVYIQMNIYGFGSMLSLFLFYYIISIYACTILVYQYICRPYACDNVSLAE